MFFNQSNYRNASCCGHFQARFQIRQLDRDFCRHLCRIFSMLQKMESQCIVKQIEVRKQKKSQMINKILEETFLVWDVSSLKTNTPAFHAFYNSLLLEMRGWADL